MRSLRPLAKVGFATPVPIMPAVSVGQWIPRSFARHRSIDHAHLPSVARACVACIPRLRPIRACRRRAEPRSRLAAGHRRRRREAALTAARTARHCPRWTATVLLAADHQLPGDAGQLVGQRHRRQLRRLARNQRRQPGRGACCGHAASAGSGRWRPPPARCRSISSPARVITPSRFLPAVEWFFGVSPSQAAKSRPDLKPAHP